MQGEGTTVGTLTKIREAFVDAATEEEELKAILGVEIIILQLIKLGKEKVQDNDNEIQIIIVKVCLQPL